MYTEERKEERENSKKDHGGIKLYFQADRSSVGPNQQLYHTNQGVLQRSGKVSVTMYF